MNKPMTKQEWLSYLEQTWDAAQKEAWSEQPRQWVGLTEEEIMDRWPFENRVEFARWVEAKLREKNT